MATDGDGMESEDHFKRDLRRSVGAAEIGIWKVWSGRGKRGIVGLWW